MINPVPIKQVKHCTFHYDACQCREEKYKAMEKELILLRERVAELEDDNYDPTPYCGACGSMTKKHCKCGPIADNE